jgi:hypothetical protein
MRRVFVGTTLACAAAIASFSEACSSDKGAASGDAGTPETGSPPSFVSQPPPDADTTVHCDTDLAADGLYQHLQCAGLYSNILAKTVAPELRPYAPALVLWADGAEKHRWLSLPAGQKIDTSDLDEWVFPNGTKDWKEFQLNGRRIETRLYAKGTDGTWRHTTYVWNDAETDAVRSDSGKSLPNGDAGVPYQVPTSNECNNCHAGKKDHVLGLEAVNLGLPSAQGITLTSLVADGLLTVPPPATTVAFPEDATGKAADALAWLHISCGPCHNRSKDSDAFNSMIRFLTYPSQLVGADAGADGGPVPVDSLDAFTTTVDRVSNVDIPDGGGSLFYLVKRGDPSSSLVSYLSGRRVGPSETPNEKQQMPPIVTRLVDTSGHQKLDDWITALPP